MHNLVDLFHAIADAIAGIAHKPTKLLAVTEVRPNFRTFIVLANHGDDARGTRYLVTVENGECTVERLAWLTPDLIWSIATKEKKAG